MIKILAKILTFSCTLIGFSIPVLSDNILNLEIPEYDLKISKTWQLKDWNLYNPDDIASIGNYIILIDRKEGDQILVIDKQNQGVVARLGKQGKGPGEFIGPWKIIISKRGNNRFCIHDIQLRKITCFNLENIVQENKPDPSFSFYLKGEAGIPIRLNGMPGADNFIITGIFSEPWRYLIADSTGRIINKSNPIDHKKGSEPLPVFQHAYTTHTASSMDGNKIAFAYMYTNIIEIYSSGGILNKRVHIGTEVFDPLFKALQTSQGPTMAQGGDTKVAYTDIESGRNHIYAVYSGRKRKQGRSGQSNTIYVYSWQGEPISKLNLEQDISECSVTLDEEKLFCIDKSKMEPMIVEYEIPEMD